MELDRLPPELIEEIASYLRLEDVIVCSSVNQHWENAFNLERIWKRFTTFDKRYFENRSSQMNYTPSNALSQSEPCPSKELALKELFVKNNFLTGRFHSEEIDIGPFYCDCVKETVDKVGNHWMFVSLADGRVFESKHNIQVWNLNCSPVLHISSETPLGETRRIINSYMDVINDRLFYVHENLVLIYEFAHPKYDLKYFHKLELSDSRFPNQVHLSVEMICLPEMIVGFAYTNFHIFQNLPPSYEVWDPEGASVCNNFEEVDFENGEPTSFPKLYFRKNHLNNIIILNEYYISERIQCEFVARVFDSKALEYSGFSIHKVGKFETFDVHEKVVIFFYRDLDIFGRGEMCVESYNVESGCCLFCSYFPNDRIDFIPIQWMVNGYLVAMEKTLLSVYKISESGLPRVSSFKLSSRHCVVYALKNNSLIVASFGKRVQYEIYNFETGIKMYNFALPSRLFSLSFKSDYCYPTTFIAYRDPPTMYAHQVFQNSIFVISFW